MKPIHITGDTMQALLLSVPLQGRHGDHILIEPPNVQYYPLRGNRIESVEIILATDLGDIVPFSYGKSQVTLHLRRVRLLDG